MSGLAQTEDANLLVGYRDNDDAGVYQLSDDLALVTTADFITPPVNDPYLFGQIAAANALSDIYAMGGEPKVCLNLVCFPSRKLPPEQLQQIIAGALSKITEAGAVLAGGHSVEDDEPKFGLSVIGLVHPRRIWRNGGAQPGDALILTKPVGSGVLFNANLKKWVSAAAMQTCIDTLIYLNRTAAEIMKRYAIHAATDVTGFGLGGHALEMAKASQATLRLTLADVPVLDEAGAMYRKGMSTGVNRANEKLLADYLRYARAYPDWQRQLLFDPQTSGGLLAALPADQAADLLAALHQAGVTAAAQIGDVAVDADSPGIIVA